MADLRELTTDAKRLYEALDYLLEKQDKANADDKGSELFTGSVGDVSPDGTECTEVKALLKEELTPSKEAFIRVQAYNAPKIRANSNTFTVKAK